MAPPPWFRQPLVWMLIAIPGSAVVFGIYMIYLAISTADGLVVDDYYKEGLAINQQIARDARAAELALAAEIEIDAGSGHVKVVFDQGRLPAAPDDLLLALRHPTREVHDIDVPLQAVSPQQYVGTANGGVHPGIWHLELHDAAFDDVSGWRLTGRARLEAFSRIQLLPLKPE
jgi:hypothetical protein